MIFWLGKTNSMTNKKTPKKTVVESKMQAAEYLKKPYGRVVTPDSDGSFLAEIIEFPGCLAVGDTKEESLANLEKVAESWIDNTLAKGQRIPDPLDNVGFSGKLVLRMPKTLHKKAANYAARDGVSLNQFIVSCISERVGTLAYPMQAVIQPFFGVQNYFLDVRFVIPQQVGPGDPRPLATVASGTQVIGIPVTTQEWQYARS
jgi:predicted RNase H-like HicB family nuclease